MLSIRGFELSQRCTIWDDGIRVDNFANLQKAAKWIVEERPVIAEQIRSDMICNTHEAEIDMGNLNSADQEELMQFVRDFFSEENNELLQADLEENGY